MGKSARKNKEKKKDFQKVKLKVGKKLAKADNFTDTTFKSRAIQIREQLKTSDKGSDEPVTQRKQNIQDLLCQVNHYNSSIRSNAMQGIKTLLTTSPALIPEHLPTLIPALSTIMSDKEGPVRQAGATLLKIVMDALAAHQMAPFFPTVCLHLCCAMTHIQEDVQLDSLIVMETILQHYPSLIAPHCKELLTNFIHLISQQRNKLGSSSSLKVNPSGKLAGQKWRLKVLQMLQKFLDVIRKSIETGKLPEKGMISQTIQVNAAGGKATYAPVLKANGAFSGRPKPFVFRPDQSVSKLGIDFLSDPEAILGVARTLVPLLLQCWGEVNLPAKGKGEGGVTIGQKEEETLSCVVAILQTVWIILERASQEKGNDSALEEMRKTYQKKIGQQFQQGFPYSLHQHAYSNTRRGNTNPSLGATPINLAVCNLVLSILVVEGNRTRPWMRMVREFVEDVLREEDGEQPLGQMEQEVLMEVVQRMISKPVDYETSISLEDALFVYYDRAHPLSQQKLRALKTVRSVCLDRARPDTDTVSTKLPAFFHSLGEVIGEARSSPLGISQEALHTLLVAASRGHVQAIQCMEKHLTYWLTPENGIIECLDEPTQRRLLECLYYLPSLNSSLMNQLARYCCMTTSDIRFPIYLIANRCFDNDLDMFRRPSLSHSSFMDFIFTVSMGISHEDLSSLQNREISNHALKKAIDPFYHVIHGNKEVEVLHRASAVNKVAMQIYMRHPDRESAMNAVQTHIEKTLKSFRHLPVRTVLSILEHTSMLQKNDVMLSTAQTTSSYTVPHSMSTSNETLESTDGMIGNLMFILFYDTAVRNVTNLGKGEEEYVMELWTMAIDCVATFGDRLIGSLMDSALCACKDHPDDRQIGNVMVRLLQTSSMKRRLHVHHERLLTLVQCIEEHLAAPNDSRWFSELKYEVNLLAKEVQLDR